MTRQEQLIDIFQDTMHWCRENPRLRDAVRSSIAGTAFYGPTDFPEDTPGRAYGSTTVAVTWHRSFEAALSLLRANPGSRVAVHNFASATNPGGGVTRGSSAQEECLCRCSTLYPALNTPELYRQYYQFHRDRHDQRYTDACIYTPGVLIVKSDTAFPERLPEEAWREVDVIICAAPNLRPRPYNAMNPGRGPAVHLPDGELLELHTARARHMLKVAAAHGAESLVLGAFGCGAFQNKPEVVAQAYREVLPEFNGQFRQIEFAVYCSPRDTRNYDAFQAALG